MRRIPFLLVSIGVLACGGSSGNSSSGSGGTTPTPTTPAISLSPATATFNVVAGATSPASQAITVNNSGTGSLTGLALGTVGYGFGQTGGWLTAVISGASAPATLTLTPSTTALAAGTYTATVPVSSTATAVANSPQSVNVTLVVAPGPATKLVFGSQPTSTNGGTITPAVTVAIEDALGDVVTTATTNVTIAIGTNAGGGTLAGTTTVAAVSGVASFANLAVAAQGNGYTLVASAAGVASATSAPFNVTAIVASLTLSAAGQSSAFLTSPNFSSTLAVQAGSQYLVEVVNTDASSATLEGFSLTGSFSSSSAAAAALRLAGAPLQPPARVNAGAAQQPAYTLSAQARAQLSVLRAAQQNHLAMLQADKQIFDQAGNPRAAWSAMRGQTARNEVVNALITPTIGAVNKIYVENSLAATCSSVDSIGARTVAVGQHVIVLADTNLTKWPQTFRPDTSFYQLFANEYDQVTWPHLIANIGNPLGYDSQLSNTGKVTVVITPTLNNIGGNGGTVLAFVSSCDFFPNRSAQIGGGFSNQTETFYSLVPSGAANGLSVATWEAEVRATAAHESKHIVSFSERILNNSPSLSDVIWLEEGLAQVSSEMWERNFNGATWLGAANFLQTVPCEYTIGGLSCPNANNGVGFTSKPLALMASHLPFLFEYLEGESASNSEGLGIDTPSNYGAGWSFGRWTTDQYASAGAEGAFIKSVINQTQTGLNSLATESGQSIQTLLVYWNLAVGTYQTPTFVAADVRTTVPSFNFANIDSLGQRGLTCSGTPCGIFTSSGSPTYPITPIAVSAASTFSKTVNGVPGTSASYFLLSAPAAGIETLNLLSPGGVALAGSSGLRVAIQRIK